MGKRNRRRQHEAGMRKHPAEPKVSFAARFVAWLGIELDQMNEDLARIHRGPHDSRVSESRME